MVFAGFFASFVQFIHDFGSAGEDFGAFDRRLFNWKLLVGTASVKGEVDFTGFVVIIKGIFHLIAVEIIFTVGNDCGRFYFDFFFAEGFDDKGGFYLVFGFEIEDLPRGSREEAVVSRVDTVF